MKKITDFIRYWGFPETDKEIDRELDLLNIGNIHYTAIVIGIVQALSIFVYLGFHRDMIGTSSFTSRVLTVFMSVVICLSAFFVSGRMMHSEGFAEKHHTLINVFVCVYFCLLSVWSMYVSSCYFVLGQQMVTFYTIQLVAVLFIKLRPVLNAAIILSSYIIFYVYLNGFVKAGMINRYNFMMMACILVAGALINYRLTVNHIKEKNRAKMLNESFEYIASHDSTTRLQNRYALNCRVHEFLEKDICLAMGDIKRFKAINDTYGHPAGDAVLERFGKILIGCFDKQEVFRYGGDEFLVVCVGADFEEFKKRFDRVNESFCVTAPKGEELRLTCSFGCVAAHPDTPAEFFEVIHDADELLYGEKRKYKQQLAKNSGVK